jgi:hypothetical protein
MTAIHPTTRQSTIEVPADGIVVGQVPNDSPETVAAKARELRLCQPEWEAHPGQRRTDHRCPAVRDGQGAGRGVNASTHDRGHPYSRRRFRMLMAVVRAAAAHGVRRVGREPRGGAR